MMEMWQKRPEKNSTYDGKCRKSVLREHGKMEKASNLGWSYLTYLGKVGITIKMDLFLHIDHILRGCIFISKG
jgi:hypothetical protein